MKTLVITNFSEKYYEKSISDLEARDDVIVIKNPQNIDVLKEQLEKHRGEFDEVFINTHGSMVRIEPSLKITDGTSLTIPEIIDLINYQNGDSAKDIHLASCHVGSHFESLENNDVSDKYYSDLSHSLQPGQTLFLHGDEHISTTREGKSRLLAIADHESGPITHSILASSEELKVIHRNHKNLRGSPSFTIFEHTPYNEFISESAESPLEHLRSYLADSLEKAKRFEIDNGIFHDPAYAKKLSKFTDEDLKKYLNEAFELELIKSPDPMQVMSDWGYLLKSGVVDVRHDNNDWTMLMYSAYHGHTDAVKALLADGEIGEKFAKKGEAALMLATRNNQKEVVEVLLDSDKLDLSHNSKSDSFSK